MSFIVEYEEKGIKKTKALNSYYECVKKANELRKEGLSAKVIQPSPRVEKYIPLKKSSNKELISRFIKLCDNAKVR